MTGPVGPLPGPIRTAVRGPRGRRSGVERRVSLRTTPAPGQPVVERDGIVNVDPRTRWPVMVRWGQGQGEDADTVVREEEFDPHSVNQADRQAGTAAHPDSHSLKPGLGGGIGGPEVATPGSVSLREEELGGVPEHLFGVRPPRAPRMPKRAAAPPASIASGPQTPPLPGAGRRKRETGSGSGDRRSEGKASPKGRRTSSPARPSLEERHRVAGSWLHHLLVSDTIRGSHAYGRGPSVGLVRSAAIPPPSRRHRDGARKPSGVRAVAREPP